MDYNEPVIEIGDDGEPHPVLGKRQTFGRAPASIAKFYCLLVGKRSAGQQLPAAKELMRLSCEDFPEDSDEERMVEIEKRIELAKWHYDHHGVKDWNLQKVAENWSIILNEWTHEKRKHQ